MGKIKLTKDGILRIRKELEHEKGLKIMYLDENDFNRKIRSLRKYCTKSYKYLWFKLIKERQLNQEEGIHVIEIPSSREFELVHGKVRLHYRMVNGKIIMEDLEPQQFLLDGYMKELGQYKGVWCRNEQDKFKINMIQKGILK